MKHSPLYDHHVKLGAVFGEVSGWEMPVHYGDYAGECAAVRSGVGLADLSHRGKLRVTGDDRVTWLQSVIANDILPLTPGQGVRSAFLNHKGKILSYFRVYAQPDALVLEDEGEVGDATFQALRKFLLYGTKAKMENCGESWGLILVSGPKAAGLIQSAFTADVEGLPALGCATVTIGKHTGLLMRTEETGETDIEMLLPADSLTAAWERLWEVGAPLGLQAVGTQARNVLRVEAGIPRIGVDLTDEIVPPEANLEGKAFSLSKGCYPGQEVVARMDTYGNVRRRLVGLEVTGQVVPAHGAKLFSGDREVGWISSATPSPRLQRVLAFGFPLRDFSAPGTPLAVEIGTQRIPATVRALPFYSRQA